MSRRKVVTILSTNYAGSHFLSLLLGSHQLARHAGELKYLRRTHRERSCPICEDLDSCPLLKGINPHTIDQCYSTIFKNFDDLGENVQILIDTSKKVKWAEKFLGRSDYQYSYIHLIRDPRALVRRWTNSYTSFKEKLHTRWHAFKRSQPLNIHSLYGDWVEVLLQKWLNENQMIDKFCRNNNLPVLTVTYRDLCQHLETSTSKLTGFLNIHADRTMLEYWKVSHHGTAKPAYKWGQDSKPEKFQDLRWQQDLSSAVIHRINHHPQLKSYLLSKNLTLLDDGLTDSHSVSIPFRRAA